MATVKTKFRPASVNEKEGTIYYQIIHNRIVRQVTTNYKVYSWEWDEKHHHIIIPSNHDRNHLLQSIHEKIRWDIERFNNIIAAFVHKGNPFNAEDIVEEFHRLISKLSLRNVMEENIAKFKKAGRIRTSETYKSTLNSFYNFNNKEDVLLDTFSHSLMESYEMYLRNRGLTPNSSSFYLRILRAVYNRACEEGIVMTTRNPFSHVYTGVGKTVKRAISIAMVKKIKNLDLTTDKATDYARDIFMLSFYMRGMSFVDLAFLKKSDLTGGVVTYFRRKTGQMLTIKWTKEMQSIIDKYPKNKTEYLLPIITSSTAHPHYQYRNCLYKVNYHLKMMAHSMGLQIPLTTYVARHSWASIAKSKGIPLSIISEGLGHESEQTTMIYLATLDTSAVDKANDLILSAL